MTLNKWNYEKETYEPFEVPDERDFRTFTASLAEEVDCAACGKKIRAGDSYTSLELNTQHGLGYMICPACREKELVEWIRWKYGEGKK